MSSTAHSSDEMYVRLQYEEDGSSSALNTTGGSRSTNSTHSSSRPPTLAQRISMEAEEEEVNEAIEELHEDQAERKHTSSVSHSPYSPRGALSSPSLLKRQSSQPQDERAIELGRIGSLSATSSSTAAESPRSPHVSGPNQPTSSASSSAVIQRHASPSYEDQIHAEVNMSGITVVSSSSTPANLWYSLSHNRSCHWLLIFIFFCYLMVVPMVLVLIFYLTLGEMLTSAICAIVLPVVLCHLIWKHMLALYPNLHQPDSDFRDAFAVFFRVVSRHWVYEIYQLLLTLLSCSTYLFYTYHLSYDIDPSNGQANYNLHLPSTSAFVQVEYFLIISLAVDYLLRLMNVKHKFAHIFSLYSLIDLLCFTGVAYINFFHANLAPRNAVYNYYLFQGPFRFLRMRRALQSLDAPIRSRTGFALYRLGPFVVAKKTAFFILFTLRVFLFICSAAALVLAFEFPCLSLNAPTKCQNELQLFHLCIYLIIVTLSTVGYGDVTCSTDAGRMLMCIVIIYFVVQVPREIQTFADLEAQQKREEQALKALTEAGMEGNQSEQMDLNSVLQSPSPNVESTSTSNKPPHPAAGDFSAQTSPSPPPHQHHAAPIVHLGASSSVPSGPGTNSIHALQAFLANDTAFLLRWTETQLERNVAHDPQLLKRLVEAVAPGTSIDPTLKDQSHRQVVTVVRALFGQQHQ